MSSVSVSCVLFKRRSGRDVVATLLGRSQSNDLIMYVYVCVCERKTLTYNSNFEEESVRLGVCVRVSE